MNLKVIETKSQPWYSAGLNFTCTQCGNCCTGAPGVVWISREEIARLAEFLHLTPEQTVERCCRKIDGRFSLNETNNQGMYDCVFLTEAKVKTMREGQTVTVSKRGCAIYPVRPLQCRTWPFWHGNLATAAAWERSSTRCPGMNTGRHFTQNQIETLRDAKDWPASPPTSKPKK
ncbi:MAG TPA: YkgJ family cysteine cluster protein [Tepidisphaeraceae bacterium]|jgi:Fe-S-cluster containining protein